ncbi:MAG: malto-oligosyltrehalose trehalohydrolase [Desulfomonile tiedjei]|uniref:Malto-oligosyltrehalose trehalohydrolase n=1 Tax=Desulfomonile tiedjei TaxID=2358 RepID=A0A9D6V4B4_9BACT|nr:malto-oligosyltrehalose trehalohydrolase [Desulfomonile tiedjei]
MTLGATYLGERRCRLCVWAPSAELVEVHVIGPHDRITALSRDRAGYHSSVLMDTGPGDLYLYRLDGLTERPDPASRFQPSGIHGPSEVTDTRFAWEDGSWKGLPLSHYILYELHVGTFTQEGTFDAIIPHLDYFEDLGITAIELMPVAQFPGKRNWGYDGVYPYAVQNSYGGPEALKRLVNACHANGIAVVLDVVYNHLGPEGNYLWDFGPYFTDRYKTPWGPAINFDGPHSDGVRRFFIENALYWVNEFHIDALRIDAVHSIYDFSARHFLEDLAFAVHVQAEKLDRRIYVIPESDLNDSRLVRSRDLGGYGLDAQWNDDFHHALHTLLTNERTGYYEDFGKVSQMVKAFREGFVFSGEYSRFRQRRHGNSSAGISAHRFVVFSQNHDQVGNRSMGDRLTHSVTMEALKLAAGAVFLSPFLPLVFMGEEFGETAPFPYFTSHSDPNLIGSVRQGRSEEFKAFRWSGEPPDPQDESTYQSAKLNHELRREGFHATMHEFYRTLITLRKELSALNETGTGEMEVVGWEPQKVIMVRRWTRNWEVALVLHFGETEACVTVPLKEGRWLKRIDSTEIRWHGPGSAVPEILDSAGNFSLTLNPQSVLLLVRLEEI